ncbi:MAG: DNA translocase FtsK 4TM domain-containing protein, partial [Candidatus Sumerlaeia bacterium]|nr:DNA translocase FtsK 4TM domain-containing protein [Candidatus Sumerlaeia bacterium]
MARRFAMRGSAPSARGRTRPARRPWLSPEVKAELRGIVFALLGLTVLLSLLVLPRHDNLVGSLGDRIAAGLTLLVGRPVAFTLPALLLWWALLSFKGRRPQHSWVKCGGAVLLMLSACALIGLATRHLPKEQSLEWAGVLGVFLAYDAPLALNLPRYLGVAGASLVFVAAAMAGLLIATGLLYTSLAGRVSAWLRAIP